MNDAAMEFHMWHSNNKWFKSVHHSKILKDDDLTSLENSGMFDIILLLRMLDVEQVAPMAGVCNMILLPSMSEVCGCRLLLAVKTTEAFHLIPGRDNIVSNKMTGVYDTILSPIMSEAGQLKSKDGIYRMPGVYRFH